LLEAQAVTKRFGGCLAVDRVDYALRAGEVAGIIGANGAGKTTLFHLLTGYLTPDDGVIRFAGRDITRDSPQKRVHRGILRTFQLASAFDELAVVDNLVLAFTRARRAASLGELLVRSCAASRGEPAIREALEEFELDTLPEREVRHISLGEKRRLEIAMTLLAAPQVLLLDEPMAGLADSEARAIVEVLRRQARTTTILVVEHKLSQVEDFLQRLTVMHEGRVIADGSFEETLRLPEVRRSYWHIGAPEDRPS
jgi:branched-chain amino acid transport system ATP-binding protein